MANQFVRTANSSGQANIEYLNMKLGQDRMLVSIKGRVLDYSVETENMEVRFVGRMAYATGKLKASVIQVQLVLEVDITTIGGKTGITIKKLNMGIMTPLLSASGFTQEKIQSLIDSTIESSGWKLAFDLQSIRIQDGKMIIEYR